MTIAEAQKLLDSVEYIPKLKNRFRKGLSIMESYYDDVWLTAEHDEIWAYPTQGGLRIEEWSKEDILEMGKYGWNLDTDIETWHHYV